MRGFYLEAIFREVKEIPIVPADPFDQAAARNGISSELRHHVLVLRTARRRASHAQPIIGEPCETLWINVGAKRGGVLIRIDYENKIVAPFNDAGPNLLRDCTICIDQNVIGRSFKKRHSELNDLSWRLAQQSVTEFQRLAGYSTHNGLLRANSKERRGSSALLQKTQDPAGCGCGMECSHQIAVNNQLWTPRPCFYRVEHLQCKSSRKST